MNLVQADSMALILAADESLIQRVASHALLSQAAGRLPRLEWHCENMAAETQPIKSVGHERTNRRSIATSTTMPHRL